MMTCYNKILRLHSTRYQGLQSAISCWFHYHVSDPRESDRTLSQDSLLVDQLLHTVIAVWFYPVDPALGEL
ncbi:hypothetical protein Agabi119p4_7071 [Agaricus bisporus var. burnettii]|uniref:Uncharacterized protein n=1 Tax=Agaricus bisporus var. burnettii TaxID=192524 RepID=A0A8H7F0Q6_AGABI|nr:hypothetical protein Agabi119p4_7071 [Agaricus bisporus var. burnettii]